MPRSKIADVQTRTRADVSVGLLLGTIAICGVIMLGSFGTSMAAGISQILNPTKINIYATDATGTQIKSGGTLKAYPFTFVASVINSNTKNYAYKWELSQNNKVIQTTNDKNGPSDSLIMDLKPGNYSFKVTVEPQTLLFRRVLSATENFKFTIANNIVCTDSDMDSNTGKSDPFMQGYTTGIIGRQMGSKQDVCKNAKVLTEYSCGRNATVVDNQVACANDCENGACLRCTNSKIGDLRFSVEPCVYDFKFFDGYGNREFSYFIGPSKSGASYSYKIEVISDSLPKGAITINNNSGTGSGTTEFKGIINDKLINTKTEIRPNVKFKVTIKYGKESGVIVFNFPLVIFPNSNLISTSTINASSKTGKSCSSNYLVGDINTDGKIDAIDVQIKANIITGKFLLKDYPCADVNNDSKFDAIDVQTLINCQLSQNCGTWPRK